jgi:hypothetical protein
VKSWKQVSAITETREDTKRVRLWPISKLYCWRSLRMYLTKPQNLPYPPDRVWVDRRRSSGHGGEQNKSVAFALLCPLDFHRVNAPSYWRLDFASEYNPSPLRKTPLGHSCLGSVTLAQAGYLTASCLHWGFPHEVAWARIWLGFRKSLRPQKSM